MCDITHLGGYAGTGPNPVPAILGNRWDWGESIFLLHRSWSTVPQLQFLNCDSSVGEEAEPHMVPQVQPPQEESSTVDELHLGTHT